MDFDKLISKSIRAAKHLVRDAADAEHSITAPEMHCDQTIRLENGSSWFCTRPYGHKGPHIAMDFEPVEFCAMWYED